MTGRQGADADRTVEVLRFEAGADFCVDEAGELHVGGKRVTLLGGWILLGVDDASIPPMLRSIRVHVNVRTAADGSSVVFVDRVRVGEIVWEDVEAFHAVFGRVWGPHLRDSAKQALLSVKRPR